MLTCQNPVQEASIKLTIQQNKIAQEMLEMAMQHPILQEAVAVAETARPAA